MNDVATRILAYNAGRDPERLALKLSRMRADPFVFLRGTCHLFHDALARQGLPADAPLAWVCGDLHFENFGSYKGDNRLAYFDINDFDEAALAPCSWDLVRFLVSVGLGARSLGVNEVEADLLGRVYLDAYATALAAGKARWVERDTAAGLVHELLDSVRQRSRPDFLDSRTELKGKRRRIRTDGKKALAVHDAQRARVEDFMRDHAQQQPDAGFFKVVDVARRIAGTGSLGLERYIVLVEGKGSPDGNYLLDLKRAVPSCLPAHLDCAQPRWDSEAERVVALQERMQAIPMAFLHAVSLEGKPFILRGLQPSEDRVALDHWKGKLRRLEEVVAVMGQLSAWAHLRSSGRSGSAIADELIDFGRRDDWRRPLQDAAADLKAAVVADWQDYARACDQGGFAGLPRR